MRAVKCPVSDATASTAPSQGQREEELLIYGQSSCKPPPHAVRTLPSTSKPLAVWGSYFPYRIAGLSPPSPPPSRASVSFPVCLFVCFALSPCWLSRPPSLPSLFLTHTQTHKYCFLCLSQTNTSKHNFFLRLSLPPTPMSRSDDEGRLTHARLVNMINSSSVQFPAKA